MQLIPGKLYKTILDQVFYISEYPTKTHFYKIPNNTVFMVAWAKDIVYDRLGAIDCEFGILENNVKLWRELPKVLLKKYFVQLS